MPATLPRNMLLPARTVSGRGAAGSLLKECAGFGSSGVLVHGVSLEKGGALARILAAAPEKMRIATWRLSGGHEPSLTDVDALRKFLCERDVDWVAGVGGGSVLDLAKAAAGLRDAPESTLAYHDGAAIPPARIPFIAVPTTAGTGSEATMVCVLTNDQTVEKKSIRHPSFMAGLVILDPDLLAGTPPHVVAASGMDALTQAVEAYVSRGATWFSDELSLKAVSLLTGNLEAFFRNPAGPAAEAVLEGSYLAGLALSHARLGLVHGLAHPLGARFKAAHGLACAICLPPVLQFNQPAIRAKYDVLSGIAGRDFQAEVGRLMAGLNLVSPFRGQELEGMDEIIRETLASGSTAANPRDVTTDDVARILTGLFRA